MKKSFLSVICAGVMIVSNIAFAGLKDCPTVAVVPFSNHAPMSSSYSYSSTGEISLSDAAIASDYVVDYLVESGQFNVIERDQMAAIMREHNLNISGMVDTNTAVKIGKLAGVQYLVYGSVVGCSLKENEAGYSNSSISASVTNKQHVVIANVLGRFIEVETGRIVLTGRGKGTSRSTHNELKYGVQAQLSEITGTSTTNASNHVIAFGTTQVSQVQVHNAIGKAAEDLVFGDMGFLAKLAGKEKRKHRKY